MTAAHPSINGPFDSIASLAQTQTDEDEIMTQFYTINGEAIKNTQETARYHFNGKDISKREGGAAKVWVAVHTEFKRRVYGISLPEGVNASRETVEEIGRAIVAWQDRNKKEGLLIPLRGAWGVTAEYGKYGCQWFWVWTQKWARL